MGGRAGPLALLLLLGLCAHADANLGRSMLQSGTLASQLEALVNRVASLEKKVSRARWASLRPPNALQGLASMLTTCYDHAGGGGRAGGSASGWWAGQRDHVNSGPSLLCWLCLPV